ncbi:MAG: hypothetical protein ISR76_06630 [Planctomycetes bacterium]|nr:hypothetical protein [Planctomycetota bacterium]
MPEPDPLDALRGAWDQLDAPPAVRELEQEDERTQAAVRWMAEAWRELGAPAAEPPAGMARRPRLRLLRSALLSAAAALLVAALGLFFPHLLLRGPTTTTVVQAPAEPASPGIPEAPVASSAPALLSTQPDRVQLRAGTLRLTMLRAEPGSPETNR